MHLDKMSGITFPDTLDKSKEHWIVSFDKHLVYAWFDTNLSAMEYQMSKGIRASTEIIYQTPEHRLTG